MSGKKVIREGWYWFLPNESCPTPTGLLRLDRPVVLLVGVERHTRDGKPVFVVRFSRDNVLRVADMSGDWQQCTPPGRMKREAMRRIVEKRKRDNHRT